MTRVSIAMAVYNGGKFLNEQLGSIVTQLTEDDEVIVSDNMSTDDSRDIILSYARTYPQIKISTCNERGITANFESAIQKCTGEYIFLADQDDVWKDNKIEEVRKNFEDTNADVVLHDCEYVDVNLVPMNTTLFKDRKAEPGYNRNLRKNAYQGCCMAFRREMVDKICPIPRNVAMHDQWIGLLAEKTGTVSFLQLNLMSYRVHPGNNSSKHVGIINKIHFMIEMKKEIAKRLEQLEITEKE